MIERKPVVADDKTALEILTKELRNEDAASQLLSQVESAFGELIRKGDRGPLVELLNRDQRICDILEEERMFGDNSDGTLLMVIRNSVERKIGLEKNHR